MVSVIRTLVILSIPILATACAGSSESSNEQRVCIYNDVEMDCAEFDQRFGTSNPPEQDSSGVPSSGTPSTGTPSSGIQPAPSQVAECVVYGVRSILSQATAERLCSKSTALGYCVADTVRAPLSQVTAERLCTESTTLAQCVANTIKGPISQVDAERLCRK